MNSTIKGRIHLKYNRSQLGNFIPVPQLASAMKLSQPQPIFQLQNSTKIRLPNGRIFWLTKKSSKSSTAEPSPNGWNPLHRL